MNSFIYVNSWVVMIVATLSLRQLKDSIFATFVNKISIIVR
jgi:hypothetical protein